jgi:hypothetical protein
MKKLIKYILSRFTVAEILEFFVEIIILIINKKSTNQDEKAILSALDTSLKNTQTALGYIAPDPNQV